MMEKPDQQQEELLSKYKKGIASPEEAAVVKYLYNLASASAEEMVAPNNYQQVGDEIWKRLPAGRKIYRLKLFKTISVAAAAILLIGGSYLWYKGNANGYSKALLSHDIAPGKNAAMLTLADGRKIALTVMLKENWLRNRVQVLLKRPTAKLIYEIKDQENADPHAVNTLTTAKGESYQLRLPDGTMFG